MNDADATVFEDYYPELCQALEITATIFLSDLHCTTLITKKERQIIEHFTLEQDKIIKALDIIKHKDNGFAFVIEYLKRNGMSRLADKMDSMSAADQLDQVASLPDSLNEDDSSIMETFTSVLIDFYLGNYRTVESFGSEGETIDTVWVNVNLEKDFDSSDNYDAIFARMMDKDCCTAIVKGQPGSGKTTLVKKIAYDWAKSKKATDEETRFDLVLAAPLRTLNDEAEPLEIALTYHCSASSSIFQVAKILAILKQSAVKILVILDGLDECQFKPNSFLAKMFSSGLTPVNAETNITPIKFNYHLLVMSRPYACQIVNENLLTHKWEIAGFTQETQQDVVRLRCKTERGKEKATEYLENSAVLREICQIPLLLLLVCFLSDQNIDIPTNLTRLYETYVLQMLIRSAKKRTVDGIDSQHWHKSELVEGLGRLALLGVIKNKFEYDMKELEMCGVGQACFSSGLLLYRSDLLGLGTKADFPHRSIQEFLAALYSVNFWSGSLTMATTTGWSKKVWPIEGMSEMKVEMLVAKMIPFGDSQFCRFYFGLLSGQLDLEVKMRRSLEECVEISLIVPHLLFCLSNSLADCSDEECFLTGEIVNSLVDKSFNWTKSGATEVQLEKIDIYEWTEEKRTDNWPLPPTTELRPQLQSGMKLKWLRNSLDSFYLRGEKQTELKLICVRHGEDNFVEKVSELPDFETVEWLWIRSSGSLYFDKLKFAFGVIKLLLKCRNCRITDESAESFVLRLWLGKKSAKKERKTEVSVNLGHAGVNPEFILFRVKRSLGRKIYQKFLLLELTDSGEVEIESIEVTDTNARRVKLSVSSNWSAWDFLRSIGDSTTKPQRCSLC